MQNPDKIEHGPGGPPPEFPVIPKKKPGPKPGTVLKVNTYKQRIAELEADNAKLKTERDGAVKRMDFYYKRMTALNTYYGAALSLIGQQLSVVQNLIPVIQYKGEDVS